MDKQNKETIIIQLGQLDALISSLSNIISKELPIKISYRLSKLLKVIASEHELMIQQRNEIINKHAEKDEDGNVKQLDDNKINISSPILYQKEINELCEIGFNVDFERVSIDELGDINISVQDLLHLDKFFID